MGKKVYFNSIKKLKKLRQKAIHVFDVETDIHGFFKLVSYAKLTKSKAKDREYDTEVKTFLDFDEFIRYLWIKKVDFIYCYNIKFDSRFLPNYLIKNLDIDFGFIESSSQLLGVKLKTIRNNLKQEIVFKDFFPFCLTSLEKISKTFKCKFPKFPNFEEKDEIKLKKLWNNFFETCNMKDLQKHCEYDVLILSELIYKYRKIFFELFKIDVLDKKIYSLASLTMKIFRANYLKEAIENPFLMCDYNPVNKKWKYRVNKRLEKMVRESYKGGYTANFSKDIHYDVVSYDINSSYPYQATLIKFPVGKAYRTTNRNLWIDCVRDIPSIAKVKVDFNHKDYYLPVLRNDGKLGRVFGKWEGVLTSYELEWLEKHDIDFEFIEGYYFIDYDKSYSVKSFCEDLYSKKLKAQKDKDESLRQIFKILLNSLTGKFGQKMKMKVRFNMKFMSEEDRDSLDYHFEAKPVLDDLFFVYQEEERISIKTYQIPIWISLITALGRIQLMDMIIETNALYCDSDSVYCERKDMINIKDSDELGNWKLEHEISIFRALAPKLYVYHDSRYNTYNIKLKGVPKDFHNKELFDEILNYKDGNLITIENIPRFCSIKEAINRVNVLEEDLLLKYDEITKRMNPKQKI